MPDRVGSPSLRPGDPSPPGGLDVMLRDTRAACVARLDVDDVRRVREALAGRGIESAAFVGFLAAVNEGVSTISGLRTMKDDLTSSGAAIEDGSFERLLLLSAALRHLDEMPRLPVGRPVQDLLCAEIQFLVSASADQMREWQIGSARFVRIAKILTNRRWPAGQFEWEVGGVARRDVLRVDLRRLPGTLAYLVVRMGGLGPVFFSHLNPRREQRSLVEAEANRSYFQMAVAMASQPNILGFAACSWFRSPGTHQVSPRLAWLSRVFVENGGWVVDAGPEDPECGVLHRSAHRRQLYESGRFKPRRGLVLWPRREMLAWAAAHPELGEPAPAQQLPSPQNAGG